MPPDRIRLIHLKTQSVAWHQVDQLPWDKTWTISHIWDRGEKTTIPLDGVSWESKSFSSVNRFNVMFEKTRQLVEARGAEYVWMDAACIEQDGEKEKVEQVPFMGTIYSKTAGCVAFGTLLPDDRFAQIASTYDDGRKAWVCDWFERVWTFQELQLPKVLLFVSGDHILTRNNIYISFLVMSPYLTSKHPSPPVYPNDPSLSIQSVLNTLSPLSRANTQRSLMESSRRGCSNDYINDKVYGILGVLAPPFSKLKVDYSISLVRAVLDLMLLMPPDDVLDTLTFNTLPPANNIHDALHWSGMVRLDEPTEHPSYEMDIHHPTDARIVAASGVPTTTVIHNAPLWKVLIGKPNDAHSADTRDRPWPAIAGLSEFAKLTDDFSRVERSADYASAVGRAERSLVANWPLSKSLLENSDSVGAVELLAAFKNLASKTGHAGNPPDRLGDVSLYDQEVTVLVCRSKVDKPFHYGIVVKPNGDGTWHKVCTASFSERCVLVRARIEGTVVIGK